MTVKFIFYNAAKELVALSAVVLYSMYNIFLHVSDFSDSIPMEIQVIENQF